MAEKEPGFFSGIASLGMLFGAIWYFTPSDAQWKNSLRSVVVANTSKDVLNYQGDIERDHYQTWTWTSKAENHDPLVTVHFKSNSGKKMKVMVFKEDQLESYKSNQSALSYNCLSRLNVVEFDCTAKIDTSGQKIVFAVFNSTDTLGDLFSSTPSAPIEFKVSVLDF